MREAKGKPFRFSKQNLRSENNANKKNLRGKAEKMLNTGLEESFCETIKEGNRMLKVQAESLKGKLSQVYYKYYTKQTPNEYFLFNEKTAICSKLS